MSRLVVLCLFFTAIAVCLCQGAPRQKRGFRNAALSTARGFGKRMQPSEVVDELNNPHTDFTRPVGSSWLADQVARSPALAKLLVEKILDQNGDGLINPEEVLQTL